MKFFSSLLAVTLSALSLVVSAADVTVKWDPKYDEAGRSLDTVACSNGKNGLESPPGNYTTLGSLPSWPRAAAVFAVEKWDSVNCGSCWTLTYTSSGGSSQSGNFTAVDVAGAGLIVMGKDQINAMTFGAGADAGSVTMDAVEVDRTYCGLPPTS